MRRTSPSALTDRILLALVLALVCVGAGFARWPELDLATTRFVYRHGGFWGASAIARDARDGLRLAPFWLLALLAGLWLARRRTWIAGPAPSTRAMIFLTASLTIGSGLIVNLGLKDHSHRPRPVHVSEFGGDEAFRPWNRFDGACVKNCAFASGEAASSFWLVAPALLAPPPWRGAAIAAAIVYGCATCALRVAFGGHFLSDVLIGGLISLVTVMALWRLYQRRRL
jgi:lipid A 4'-phosphatase